MECRTQYNQSEVKQTGKYGRSASRREQLSIKLAIEVWTQRAGQTEIR